MYVMPPERITVSYPNGVSAADAAGLPVASLAALQALKSIGNKFDGTGGFGTNALIMMASGGVGTYVRCPTRQNEEPPCHRHMSSAQPGPCWWVGR